MKKSSRYDNISLSPERHEVASMTHQGNNLNASHHRFITGAFGKKEQDYWDIDKQSASGAEMGQSANDLEKPINNLLLRTVDHDPTSTRHHL